MEKDRGSLKKTVGVVGIPFSHGQSRRGTERGPAVLREYGLITQLQQLGHQVVDYGDLNLQTVEEDMPWNHVKNPRTVGQANKQVADCVSKITQKRGEQVALTMGGDHSIATGSIFGHCQTRPDLVVVWVDAHADLNSPLSSASGNLHGMPLSFLLHEMKRYVPRLPGYEWCQPCVSAKDLVYVGLRDVDEPERAFISELGIPCFSMTEIDKYGIQGTMDRALKSVDPSGNRPIHLSFDVDVLDPEYAPSTGTPVPGGLTRREMLCIAEEIAKTGRLSCLDVVEVNPSLGTESDLKKTARSAVDVAAHFFGKRREGNVSSGFQLPVSI